MFRIVSQRSLHDFVCRSPNRSTVVSTRKGIDVLPEDFRLLIIAFCVLTLATRTFERNIYDHPRDL